VFRPLEYRERKVVLHWRFGTATQGTKRITGRVLAAPWIHSTSVGARLFVPEQRQGITPGTYFASVRRVSGGRVRRGDSLGEAIIRV
jgi:hypothetical protein